MSVTDRPLEFVDGADDPPAADQHGSPSGSQLGRTSGTAPNLNGHRSNGVLPTHAPPVAVSRSRLLARAELALALLTVAGTVGLARLFTNPEAVFLVVVPMALGGHLLAALTRHARLPFAGTYVISCITLPELISLGFYSDTLRWGFVPTGLTWEAARVDLQAAVENFRDVVAPAEMINGYLIVMGALAWLLAIAADAAAFRIKRVTAALAPVVVATLLLGSLATDTAAVLSGAAVALTAIVFVAAHRQAMAEPPWVVPSAVTPAHKRQHARQAMQPVRPRIGRPIALAASFGVVAALGASLLLPLVPGSGQGFVDLRDIDGVAPSPRRTLSPLVDARGRLTNSSSNVMFRVESDLPAYWRTSGLGTFNGAVWGSNRSYSDALGELRRPLPDEVTFDQRFTVGDLSSIWIPAGFEPVSLAGIDALYDHVSGALVTGPGGELVPGASYTVTSARRSLSPQLLRDADLPPPLEFAAEHTALPDGFSPAIVNLATDVTAGADTTYDRALALQNYFRDNFAYSLAVEDGHSNDRMERFLFEDRAGYCEQFAGTYAAMARAVGIPARVAVGFTPGELIDGVYVVRGEHYHAWPEVWIGGRWLAFEPTPGRGAPGAESYTLRAPQQAGPGNPSGAGAGTENPADQANESGGSAGDFTGFVDVLGTSPDGDGTGRWARWVAGSVVSLGAITLVWALVVPLRVFLRRKLRHRRARGDTRAETMASWVDLVEVLRAEGVGQHTGESAREYGARATQRLRLPRDEAAGVVGAVEVACYSPDAPAAEDVVQTRGRVAKLKSQLRRARPFTESLKSVYRRRKPVDKRR